MSHSQCHLIYCHNPAVSFILVCQITQRCPAKHFLPLTHSLKELAAIISRSDQRQRHGRVTPSVHNQRTIHFKGQGNGCSYIRAKRKSHWDILLPLKWRRRKCSLWLFFFKLVLGFAMEGTSVMGLLSLQVGWSAMQPCNYSTNFISGHQGFTSGIPACMPTSLGGGVGGSHSGTFQKKHPNIL